MKSRYEKAALGFSNLSNLNRFIASPYNYVSHTFNPGVVCAYNNLVKYVYVIDRDSITIEQLRKRTVLLLNPESDFVDDSVVYCEEPFLGAGKKIKEVVYDLHSIFIKPSKEIRRGIHVNERKDVVIIDYIQPGDFTSVYKLFEDWVEHKNADPKVFHITFSPTRYANSLYLKDKLPNIYHKNVYIKEELYATLVFHLNPETKIAYELTFFSKFWDTNLKLINDLNFCILIWCFHDLYAYYGIRSVNVGTAAGIKGLTLFKNKIPHSYNIVYNT